MKNYDLTRHTGPEDLLERLHHLSLQHDEALFQLRQALAIERLWPEAFEDGRTCTVQAVIDLDGPNNMLFHLIRSDGQGREFDDQFPRELWPVELNEDLSDESPAAI